MKKVHWTQRPENRERLVAMARKRARKHAKNVRKIAKQQESYSAEESQVTYALGRVQGWLDAFAEGVGLSQTALAYRVGELLYRKSRRKVVGA